MHVQVCTLDRCCEHQCTHLLLRRSLQDAHMRLCICSLFVQRWGNEDGGVQVVYDSTCCLALGLFLTEEKIGVLSTSSLFFNAGGSVCGCMWVYTHTRTHTAQMGYPDVSPGVGIRHLEGSKNPDGLNFAIDIFVYVYKVHVCMYMLGGGMRSWTNCFFMTYFFFQKRKAKDVNANHR